jgi:hypothetical protein
MDHRRRRLGCISPGKLLACLDGSYRYRLPTTNSKASTIKTTREGSFHLNFDIAILGKCNDIMFFIIIIVLVLVTVNIHFFIMVIVWTVVVVVVKIIMSNSRCNDMLRSILR